MRALNIPAFTNGASRGILHPDDPHYFHRTRGAAFAEADVIVVVGMGFDFRMGYGKRLRKDATVVHIDLDYRTRRQEPGRLARHGRRPRRDPVRSAGRHDGSDRQWCGASRRMAEAAT